MKPIATIAAATLLLAGASRAEAALINASFAGTVSDQANTAYAVGTTVTGAFSYSTDLSRYLSFTIGGYSLPAGAASYAPPPLARTQSVQFSAISAAGATGGATNTGLTLDLETNGTFDTTDLLSFVQSPGPGSITTNPADPNPSFFEYAAGASGSHSTYVTANLTSFAATVTGATRVPEPASLALLGAGLAGLAAARRRRA